MCQFFQHLVLHDRFQIPFSHLTDAVLWVIAVKDGYVITDRKSTRLNSSHVKISYAVFCLKKKKNNEKKNSQIAAHRASSRNRLHQSPLDLRLNRISTH